MEITTALEKDLDWRSGEIASLRIAVVFAEQKDNRRSALLRSAAAILYAHYEGFTKYAWESYVDYIKAAEVCPAELCDGLARFSLRPAFSKLRGNMSDNSLWNFALKDFNRSFYRRLDDIPVPSTESNLWPAVFRTGCADLGLVVREMDTYESRIKSLVGKRNAIAHGEAVEIKDIEELGDYEAAAFGVMYGLAYAIDNSISGRAFLQTNEADSQQLLCGLC